MRVEPDVSSRGGERLRCVLLLLLLGAVCGPVVANARDPELRLELQRRFEADQAARQEWIEHGQDEQTTARVARIDQENGIWLKALIADRGWPGYALVDKDGAHAAWLLVQHQDADPAFQHRCLDLLVAAVARHDASPADLAYLTDRVLLAEGRKQLYGTQCMQTPDGDFVLRPLESPERVDELRRSVGLPPLAEYLEQVKRTYRPKGR